MGVVSIASGGGDLGNGGGGRRRIAAEPESVTSPRFGGKWRKLPACRSGVAAEATRGVQAAGIRATCMSGGSRELSRTREAWPASSAGPRLEGRELLFPRQGTPALTQTRAIHCPLASAPRPPPPTLADVSPEKRPLGK